MTESKKPEKKVTHQFGLFGYVPPKKKIPISKEQIEAVKKLMAKKDYRAVAGMLRDWQDRLERFEKRL